MDQLERIVLTISGLLMVVFFGALVWAASALNVTVPTCVTDVAPFRQGKVIQKGDHRFEVHLAAKMWAFDPAEIELPPGSDVDLYLSTLDVTHGVYVENTNVNLMAVPGVVNAARVHFDAPGEHRIICNEYCGVAHQAMAGKFVIREANAAIAAQTHAEPEHAAGGEAAAASAGQQLFNDSGCPACHTVDGSPSVGPTMKGLLGRTTELADGSTIKADEHYIASAIRDPNAAIVKDYQPIMPQVPLTDAQVELLVEYIESLS